MVALSFYSPCQVGLFWFPWCVVLLSNNFNLMFCFVFISLCLICKYIWLSICLFVFGPFRSKSSWYNQVTETLLLKTNVFFTRVASSNAIRNKPSILVSIIIKTLSSESELIKLIVSHITISIFGIQEFIFTQILTNDSALPESFEGTWPPVNRQYMLFMLRNWLCFKAQFHSQNNLNTFSS